MEKTTRPPRPYVFLNNLLNGLVSPGKPSQKNNPGKKPSNIRVNRQERKDFSFYEQVFDQDTQEVVGHLADISSGGFKLDSKNPIQLNKDFRFSMNLNSEVADKPSMIFVARSRWCKVDPLDPFVYNVGYQLIHIAPGDLEIFNRMMEKYGRSNENRSINLRQSNRW